MPGDLNVVALVGRLVRDADLKYTNGGMAILRFSIAINRMRRSQDSYEEETNYFDCVYFGRAAESVNQYLAKGRQVAISGELRQSRWEQDGQTRSRVEIAVNNLTLLSQSTHDGEAGGQFQSQSRDYQRRQEQREYQKSAPKEVVMPEDDGMHGPEDFSDDTIPF